MIPTVEILEVALDFGNESVHAGRLALDENNVGVFEHDRAFVASGLRINPLFSTEAVVEAQAPSSYDRIHGVFADSLPDAWGRLVTQRRLEEQGISYASLSPLQKLALVGSRGMGALVYRPQVDDPAPMPATPDIDVLAHESLKILEGAASESIVQLERLGGFSGGTRPKVLIFMNDAGQISTEAQVDYAPWIIKFRDVDDLGDAGPLEIAYADMARSVGVTISQTRLVPSSRGQGYFATKRFDRGANGVRLHMASAAGLLDAPWRTSGMGYEQLLKLVRAVTRRHGDVEQMFRRMLFNVLANNRDDHTRQHSFLMDESGTWSLAPAYDLTFSSGPAGQHYLTVNEKGTAVSLADVRVVAALHAVKNVDAIVHDVVSGVGRFEDFATTHDVTQKTRALARRQLDARLNELER